VRAQVATVLGHASSADVEVERAFKELGFDSLGAMQLHNRLERGTGLSLPVHLIFDYPNVGAVAGFLLSEVRTKQADELIERLSTLEKLLGNHTLSGEARARIEGQLHTLLRVVSQGDGVAPSPEESAR